MQLRHFVSLSAVVLCGWLAITFVTEVPTKRYPKLDRQVVNDGADGGETIHHIVATDDGTEKSLTSSMGN